MESIEQFEKTVDQLEAEVDEFITSMKADTNDMVKRGEIEKETFIWELLSFSKDKKIAVMHWNTMMNNLGAPMPETKDYLFDQRWFDFLRSVNRHNYLDVLTTIRASLCELCKQMPQDQAHLILTLDKFKVFQGAQDISTIHKKLYRLQKLIAPSYFSKLMYSFPDFFQRLITLADKHHWKSVYRFLFARGFNLNGNKDLFSSCLWLYNHATNQNRTYIANQLEKILKEEKI